MDKIAIFIGLTLLDTKKKADKHRGGIEPSRAGSRLGSWRLEVIRAEPRLGLLQMRD
jgi:hypothetical protein